MMLCEIADDPRVAEQFTEISVRLNQIEMISPLEVLGDLELTIQTHRLLFHQSHLIVTQAPNALRLFCVC
jgi:hypothetical protein